jgi:hypothetical protein
LEIDHGAFPGLRTLNEFVCNSLSKFSAVPIRRNLFTNVIQSSRHIGNRVLIELSKHIAPLCYPVIHPRPPQHG